MLEDVKRYYRDRLDKTSEPLPWEAGTAEGRSRSEVRNYARVTGNVLDEAQSFVLDYEAAEMLVSLATDLGDGAWDMFRHTKLPFNALWLEHDRADDPGATEGALLTSFKEDISVMYMRRDGDRVTPALAQVLLNSDGSMNSVSTPMAQAAADMSTPEHASRIREGVTEYARKGVLYYAMNMTMSAMLDHKGMLEREEAPAYTRADRRRAARRGEKLPDTRVSHIRLGEYGRGQLEAMRAGAETESDGVTRRRAHWVRGHLMRKPSGGVTWRMPHVRGAGPVIGQERRVGVATGDTPEM